MSSVCRCLRPDGGGTKCPSQHVAVCIRESDGECYGECIAIPGNYQSIDPRFTQWLNQQLTDAVREFVYKNTSSEGSYLRHQPITGDALGNYSGRLTFDLGSNRIFVRFQFEFAAPQRGGLQLGEAF